LIRLSNRFGFCKSFFSLFAQPTRPFSFPSSGDFLRIASTPEVRKGYFKKIHKAWKLPELVFMTGREFKAFSGLKRDSSQIGRQE
jgi:hypothetical protein